MAFIDEVRTRSRRFQARLEHLNTEEGTKTALVMPFIQMLGYNIFDPTQVIPEFTADFGKKKGEKVDYAIVLEGRPVVLIEAKRHGTSLLVAQESQLFRYFAATAARFGILTDGIVYRFYSDLDDPGKMDQRPFFEFNMLDFTDLQVGQLKQFHRDRFDPTETVVAARELKYTNEVKQALAEEIKQPSDDFVRFILSRIAYPGPKTQLRVAQFAPLVQAACAQFVNDRIDARLKSALDRGNELADGPEADGPEGEATTSDEPAADGEYPLQLFLAAKGIEARARYDGPRTFVVLAGSQAAKDNTPRLPKHNRERRKALIGDGILLDEGATYRLTSDQTFTSPSGASSFLLGRGSSGPSAWRDAEGRSLGEIVER